MKRIIIALALAAALQGCAVNVITAPHASFQLTTGGGWAEHSKLIQDACDAALDAAIDESGIDPAELATESSKNYMARLNYRCNEKLGNTL